MKDIEFLGQSLANLKAFPDDARRSAGHQLDRVQRGLDPNDWKPISSIGSGVREIRVKDADGIYRVIYVAKFHDAVYVLHAFQKKTQKTPTSDIELARQAYKKIVNRSMK